MNKSMLILSVISFLILVSIFLWLYVFNIYEVKIRLSRENLIEKSNTEMEISVIPLNSFGGRALFREVIAEFDVIEGKSLITFTKLGSDKIAVSSKGGIGKVTVLVNSNFGIFPSKVEFLVVREQTNVIKEF